MIYLPCPRCLDDSTLSADRRYAPRKCQACGWWAAVAIVGTIPTAVSGKPGRNRRFSGMRGRSVDRKWRWRYVPGEED